MARAASIRPCGISNRLFSTNLAMKGAAAKLKGTKAAETPIEVPTICLVKGIIQTIRIINGMDRNILTNMASN
ncbi:hypothetical protein D3C86_1756900 [compost metagenome]